jgi:hypothetical protein
MSEAYFRSNTAGPLAVTLLILTYTLYVPAPDSELVAYAIGIHGQSEFNFNPGLGISTTISIQAGICS